MINQNHLILLSFGKREGYTMGNTGGEGIILLDTIILLILLNPAEINPAETFCIKEFSSN